MLRGPISCALIECAKRLAAARDARKREETSGKARFSAIERIARKSEIGVALAATPADHSPCQRGVGPSWQRKKTRKDQAMTLQQVCFDMAGRLQRDVRGTTDEARFVLEEIAFILVNAARVGEYEGWSNRETWAVALWIDNDRVRLDKTLGVVCVALDSHTTGRTYPGVLQAVSVGFAIRDHVCLILDREGNPWSLSASMADAAFQRVSWRELAEHYMAKVEDGAASTGGAS